MTIQSTTTLDLPASDVFFRCTDISKWDLIWPDVVRVEILSGVTRGAGLRFKETRRHGAWTVSRVYEVAEWREGEHLRLVSETPDETILRTLSVETFGSRARLSLEVERRPRSMSALLRDLVGKVVESAEEASWRRDFSGIDLARPRRAAS